MCWSGACSAARSHMIARCLQRAPSCRPAQMQRVGALRTGPIGSVERAVLRQTRSDVASARSRGRRRRRSALRGGPELVTVELTRLRAPFTTDLPMQRNHSTKTNRYAGVGMLLSLASWAGCMAGGLDAEQVEPGQTSSELAATTPGITTTPSGVAGAAAVILGGAAGAPAVLPTTSPCVSDADCHVAQDNCSECACHALNTSQSMPACNGAKVTCVLDPCADAVPRCIQGHCAAESDSVR